MRFSSVMKIVSALLGFVCSISPGWGQGYPNKPVRVIVPVQAGAGSDLLMRFFADALSQSLGQRFVVENRPGAAGNMGMAAAAKAAPDGYTLVQGSLGQSVLNQFLYSSLEYNPEKDFDPVVLLAKLPFVIAANPDFPVKSLAELIAASKAKPDTINVATTSPTARVLYEIFRTGSGAQLFPVRYAGPAAALPDVLNGRVPIFIETVAAVRSLVSSGKLKPLAITSQRSGDLVPGVKSVAEQGVQGFNEVVGWIGMFAPAGSPQVAVKLLNGELNRILGRPETRQRLLDFGGEPASGTPEELNAYVVSEREKWGQVIKSANIKVD
ncbi:MAG: tripartite tricarboxylate transporter substrate binding protein [Betaproteobacteria bacterium]|nr:tripartite tricarboxylate transporter substrate binding protein [Betaproteobacteria bacterium]